MNSLCYSAFPNCLCLSPLLLQSRDLCWLQLQRHLRGLLGSRQLAENLGPAHQQADSALQRFKKKKKKVVRRILPRSIASGNMFPLFVCTVQFIAPPSTASPSTHPTTSWSAAPVTAPSRSWTCWRDASSTPSTAIRWRCCGQCWKNVHINGPIECCVMSRWTNWPIRTVLENITYRRSQSKQAETQQCAQRLCHSDWLKDHKCESWIERFAIN